MVQNVLQTVEIREQAIQSFVDFLEYRVSFKVILLKIAKEKENRKRLVLILNSRPTLMKLTPQKVRCYVVII